MTATATDGWELDLERTFSVPRARLYQAWLEREAMAHWICHDGERTRVRILKFDPRPSGGFRVDVHRDSQSYLIFGTFETIAPPALLVLSWAWERLIPDPGQVTSRGPSTVTVTFRERGDETALRLTQGTFPTAARRDADRTGWEAAFDALALWLRAPTAVDPAAARPTARR